MLRANYVTKWSFYSTILTPTPNSNVHLFKKNMQNVVGVALQQKIMANA